MYEELVKRLREHGEFLIVSDKMKVPPNVNVRNVFAEDYEEAADAIEELQKQVEDYECRLEISPEAEYAIDKHCDDIISRMDKLIKGLDDKPRWIPVTERLPRDGSNVIVCTKSGNVGEAKYQAALDYGLDYPAIWFLLNDYGNQYQTEELTAWQPLPEPTKEKT